MEIEWKFLENDGRVDGKVVENGLKLDRKLMKVDWTWIENSWEMEDELGTDGDLFAVFF